MSVARVLLFGLVISVAAVSGPAGPGSQSSSFGWPEVVSSSSSFRAEADIALAEWALGRFAQAGLSLPELTLRFHDEKSQCQGHNGYFQPGSPHRIDICGFNWNRFLLTPRKVMVHEMAHVWVHDNLDAQTRLEFLELRGLEQWRDADAAWAEQGMEHAAEILAWGLMDEEISMSSIGESDGSHLIEAYRLLTESR